VISGKFGDQQGIAQLGRRSFAPALIHQYNSTITGTSASNQNASGY
jgi:hypothetical protein